jgi:hypothetical protein
MAGPFHFILATHGSDYTEFPWWSWLGVLCGFAAGAAAVVLPLRAGARYLRGMEF